MNSICQKPNMIIKREHYQEPVGKSPFIYAGYICNNNCIFCFEKDQDFFDKGTQNLRKEMKVIRSKFDFINFMGQEPTLRGDIVELINYARELKFKQIGTTTNGRMFAYSDFTRRLMAAGLTQAVITVAGHTTELHDLHTAAKGSFDQTLRGIKNFISQNKKGLSLVINLMVTNLNFRNLLEMVKFYLGLGVKEINIGHILPFNQNIINSRKIVAKMSDVVPYLIKIQDKYGLQAKFLFVEYPPCVFPEEYRHLSFPCLEESPQKIHFDLCKKCPNIKKCDGVHQYYLNLYGTKEFKL